MNQALKTVLPIKRKENEKQKQTIALALEPQAARTLFLEKNRKNSVARERLLEALIEQGELPKEIITKKLDVYKRQSQEHPTTDDMMFTVETVSCLGACGLAPVCTVNDKVHPAMTPEKARALIEELKEEAANEN